MKNRIETLEYTLQFAFQSILREGYKMYDYDQDRANTLANYDTTTIDKKILVEVLDSDEFDGAISNIISYVEDNLVDDNIMSDFIRD